MTDWELLNKIDHEMMMVDVNIMEWQGCIDRAALAGAEITTYQPELPFAEPNLTFKRVPLVKYEDGKRIVIGVADVNQESGVVKAEVQTEHAELLGIPGIPAVSIADEDPPLFNHRSIKSQLYSFAKKDMYINPFKIQGVTTPVPIEDSFEIHPPMIEGLKKYAQEVALQNLDDAGFFDYLKEAGDYFAKKEKE